MKTQHTHLPHLAVAAILIGGLSQSPLTGAEPAVIRVQVDRPGHRIPSTLWGVFFEEINHAGDGGLYAELVRNRSFEDGEEPAHWTTVTTGEAQARLTIDTATPLNPLNRRSGRLEVTGAGCAGLVNQGFWGIALQAGQEYSCRFSARASTNTLGPITVSLEDAQGKVYVHAETPAPGSSWATSEVRLRASVTDPKARLVLTVSKPGTVWFDMVSLFPATTWKGRPNGLRADLAEMLEGLKPSFVRFPGGCWVEGHDLKNSYRWKETVGHVAHRRNQYNLWQYQSTHGLGYHEYLELCEDLGAEPMFVINCGMSHSEVVPLDQMTDWVQDALDAIEYANGPTNSLWGGLRARNGHPAPFGLKWLEVGNENGGPAYHERYALFHDAVQARYPEVRLIANEWGGTPKDRPLDIVDEHYYSTPEFFLGQADRYDRYDRNGPKVYVGEYAVTAGCGQGNLRAAVGEAAFMTGMERNSDVVIMASYAPLFANVNYKKWNPDLINFDSHRVYGTPSYHVQRLFSEHRGDAVLPVTVTAPEVPPATRFAGGIGVGTWMTQAEYKDLRVVKGGRELYRSDFARGAGEWTPHGGQWAVHEGAWRQSQMAENVQSIAGDTNWTDYTYTLKARKLGGAEGFLVMFQVLDSRNWVWLNLGGWGNRQHAIERSVDGGKAVLGKAVEGRIEEGRWYEVRIELKGRNIRGYLDNTLVVDADHADPRPLHASATWDRAPREVIVKVVNAAAAPTPVRLDLAGRVKAGPVRGWQLTSANPGDENTLDAPNRVAPQPLEWTTDRGGLTREFPGNSVTVLRFQR